MHGKTSKRADVAATVYEGGAGCGKTAALLSAALEYAARREVGAGTAGGARNTNASATVLVLCASPLACQSFTRRLASASCRQASRDAGTSPDPGVDSRTDPCAGNFTNGKIKVCTARELALEILAVPGVAAKNGRDGRVLTGASTRFLAEDMKTTGLKQRRLKEMLLFFCKSFSELADEEEDWLVLEEERMVHDRLQRLLDMRRAYIEPQVCAAALRAVEGDPTLKEAFGAAHVLFDDYQCASRASQLLACALAGRTLDVAFDAACCTEVFDSYPYERGADELAERFEQLAHVKLESGSKPDGIARALERLAKAGEEDADTEDAKRNGGTKSAGKRGDGTKSQEDRADEGASSTEAETGAGVTLRWTQMPRSEFTRLAEAVSEIDDVLSEAAAENFASAVGSNGAANPSSKGRAGNKEKARAAGSSPSANGFPVVVATPNPTWAKNCVRALRERGVACEAPLARARCTSGKSPAADADARTLCLLRLLADPRDALAWRDWCGFGDHLARSGAFSALADYVRERSLSLYQALDGLAEVQSASNGEADGEASSGGAEQAPDAVGLHEVVELFDTTRATIETLAGEKVCGKRELLEKAARAANNDEACTPSPLLQQLCLGSAACAAKSTAMCTDSDGRETAAACTGKNTDAATSGNASGIAFDNAVASDGAAAFNDGSRQTPQQLAAGMCARADSLACAPRLLDARAVPVAPYAAFAGCDTGTLFVTGFVNGFFPDYDYFDTTVTLLDKQPAARRKDTRTLYGLAACARDGIELSGFDHVELEAAEMLRVKIKRIYLDNGTRACKSIPSDFLAAFER